MGHPIIVALLALSTGCGGLGAAPLSVPAGAQAGDLVGVESCTYKVGRVEYAADCGTLVVPENRGDPDSRLIALPVIRVRATGVAVESTGWPTNLIPKEKRRIQPSDVETLLVSGNIDLNTPVQFARDQLLPSLSNGQHVILSEFGHGEYLRAQPEASIRLLTSFYDTGVADDSFYTHHPVSFRAGLGYPALAKLGLAAIVLIIVLLGALGWFIARKLRQRRAEQIEL